MKYLTFLDYTTLEVTGKNIESKLSEKEKEIQLLRQRDSVNTDAISNLSDQVMKLMYEVNKLKKYKSQLTFIFQLYKFLVPFVE